VSEALCQRILSLPMHPYLTEDEVSRVIAAMRAAL
jgi:dTDP-4-amino-4,6-dideoxygalactose transaminase